MPKPQINYINGDLFKVAPIANQTAVAHCISADCAMGAGIAKTFRRLYPAMPNYVLNKLQTNHVSFPAVVSYTGADKRLVYNLVTKGKYWQKSTADTIARTLITLRNGLVAKHKTQLYIPLIGAGLDRVPWSKTEANLQRIFANTDITITVCQLKKH